MTMSSMGQMHILLAVQMMKEKMGIIWVSKDMTKNNLCSPILHFVVIFTCTNKIIDIFIDACTDNVICPTPLEVRRDNMSRCHNEVSGSKLFVVLK
jgi:hypothetical protein